MTQPSAWVPTGPLGRLALSVLDRSAEPTWVWERRALMVLEAVSHIALVVVSPTFEAMLIMILGAPIAVYGSLLAQTARSAASRKREFAEMMGEGPLLDCEVRVEMAAKRAQFLASTQPIIALAMATAVAGGRFTWPAIVGALVGLLRVGWAQGYIVWRRWMRMRRPRRCA